MKDRLKFIDLFCGIGGFRIALNNLNCECVFSCDADKFARKTYETNFDEVPDEDINDVDISQIPHFDILCAGFPCQPFSKAGLALKALLGKDDGFNDLNQGILFFKVAEILKHHQPKAFILENVKNLKSHDGGNTYTVIMSTLKKLGYTVFDKVIDACSYVPQHRERIFIVGFKDSVPFQFPATPNTKPTLTTILESTVDAKYTLSNQMWQFLQDHKMKHQAKGNGFGYGLFNGTNQSRTLLARYYKDGSDILIEQKNSNPRRLTPTECKLLMGFPQDFKIPVSDTQAYKQFGNSVVPQLIEDIANEVIKHLIKENHNGN